MTPCGIGAGEEAGQLGGGVDGVVVCYVCVLVLLLEGVGGPANWRLNCINCLANSEFIKSVWGRNLIWHLRQRLFILVGTFVGPDVGF